MKTSILYLFMFCFLLAGCTNKHRQAVIGGADSITEITLIDTKADSIRQLESKKMWEAANKYRASITDTTFLETKGKMSDLAIEPLTGDGLNKDYAFNQVVYLKALERAKKHLFVKNNQLVCTLKEGKEIYISEDLYHYIVDLFNDWNRWLKSDKYEISKDEKGYYEVLPKKKN